MKEKSKRIAVLTSLLGPILIFLSLCFPWVFFEGTAQYPWEKTVEVSGWISAVGVGSLDKSNAEVTMWSSPTYWSSAGSDFWFGYLTIVGLILVSAFVLVFMKTDRLKISMLLALTGLTVISASLIATIYYQPQIFVIQGQIYDIPVGAALLYATQATVNKGLSPWLSLIGGLIPLLTWLITLKPERRNDELVKPELNTLEACNRLVLIEGHKEKRKKEGEK